MTLKDFLTALDFTNDTTTCIEIKANTYYHISYYDFDDVLKHIPDEYQNMKVKKFSKGITDVYFIECEV